MNALTTYEVALGVLYSFLVGAALGVLWDVLRVFRFMIGLRPNAKEAISVRLPLVGVVGKTKVHGGFFAVFIVFLCDVVFFAAATVIYCVFVFNAGYGQNRWFFSLGALSGFLAYLFTVGKLVMRASGFIRLILSAAASYIWYFASLPFKAARKFIVHPLAEKFAVKISEKRTKKARKALAQTLKMVYNTYEGK